jgi:hypothetical protein
MYEWQECNACLPNKATSPPGKSVFSCIFFVWKAWCAAEKLQAWLCFPLGGTSAAKVAVYLIPV